MFPYFFLLLGPLIWLLITVSALIVRRTKKQFGQNGVHRENNLLSEESPVKINPDPDALDTDALDTDALDTVALLRDIRAVQKNQDKMLREIERRTGCLYDYMVISIIIGIIAILIRLWRG